MAPIQIDQADELRPRISIIGVGGAGGNAVAHMIAQGVSGVEFIVANTDAQAVGAAYPAQAIQLGRVMTEGLGAGSVVAVGKAAAEESIEEIERAIHGSHMCFIAAGMGGGTGTGAAPVIAAAARRKGILTIGVVTKPFAFEGNRRTRSAEAGIEELRQHVDTLIVIPNQNLFRIADKETTFRGAFKLADDVLLQGVRGITDLMVMPGLVNLDFADVRSVMSGMGQAMMGTGEAEGANRAIEAAERAISNPLLDGMIDGARGLIISITGGEDLGLMEMDEAINRIKDLIDPEADIIWGAATDKALKGRMRVSIVATGLEAAGRQVRASVSMPSFAPVPLAVVSVTPLRPNRPAIADAIVAVLSELPVDAPTAPDLFEEYLSAIADGCLEPGPSDGLDGPLPAERDIRPVTISGSGEVQGPVAEAGGARSFSERSLERGPSLFERVAAMARGPASIRRGFDLVERASEFQIEKAA